MRYIRLTEPQWEALCLVIENGWGDGDFARWGGLNPAVQRRAMEVVDNAPTTDDAPTTDELIAERDALLVTRDELTEALVRLTKEAAALCDALKAARGES